MKKKDIKLFDKTIHEIKDIIKNLTEERNLYHKVLDKLTKKHDRKINKMLKETNSVLNEMYELYDDLSNGEGQ